MTTEPVVGERKLITLRIEAIHEERLPDSAVEVWVTEEFARRLKEELAAKLSAHTHVRFIPYEHKPETITEKFKPWIEAAKPSVLPPGYVELGRRDSDPRSHRGSLYIYAKRATDGSYGFRVINGKVSPFHGLGRIADPQSQIGNFLRKMPADRMFTKQDCYQMRIGPQQGQSLKAVLDILEIEGYLLHRPLSNRRDSVEYYRTDKTDGLGDRPRVEVSGLEVESNREPEKVPVPPAR